MPNGQRLVQDVLSKFQGTWTIYPGPPAEEAVEGHTTRVCLEQDVLPVGASAQLESTFDDSSTDS